MDETIKKIVSGAIALMTGLGMFTLGAGSIDIIHSIVGRIVAAVAGNSSTLGVLNQVSSTVSSTIPMLGIVFIAAGGALVLWGLFDVLGSTPMGKYWQ